MTRPELAALLLAASRVTGDPESVVLGSQSILGSHDEAVLPPPATASMEAVLAYLDDPGRAKSNRVEAEFGELSDFHLEHGYYAEGVDVELAVLPVGWRDRLFHPEAATELPPDAWFLDKHDLAIAKLVAHREKDRQFVGALLDAGLLDVLTLRDRVDQLPTERGPELRSRLHRWLDHGLRTPDPTATRLDHAQPAPRSPLAARQGAACGEPDAG